MERILALILSLPFLYLSKSEWLALKQLLTELPDKKTNTFIAALETNEAAAIKPAHQRTLKIYIEHWNRLTSGLLEFKHYIEEIWGNVAQCALGMDQFLPLLIELLPNSPRELKKTEQILTQAMEFEDKHETGFILLTFYSGVVAKLNCGNDTGIEKDAYKDQIMEVVYAIRLESLKRAVQAYQLHLKTSLAQQLQQSGYLKNFDDSINHEVLLTSLFSKLDSGEFLGRFYKDELFNYLDAIYVEKYLAMTDLNFILNQFFPNNVTRMLAFAIKFIQDQKNIFTLNVSLRSRANIFYHFFKVEDPEKKFLDLAKSLSEQILVHSTKELSVTKCENSV